MGITAQRGYDQLRQGLQASFAGAKSSEDFAAKFAKVYDQTVMAIPAGKMLQLPATNVRRRIETTVTRVPRAPFLALVLLDLIYAAIGVVLTIFALIALFRGRSVRDAQARLSVAALVAESFESPALQDDAKNIDDLYAERRGLTTQRVVLERKEDGGRRYEQISALDERRDREKLLGRREGDAAVTELIRHTTVAYASLTKLDIVGSLQKDRKEVGKGHQLV